MTRAPPEQVPTSREEEIPRLEDPIPEPVVVKKKVVAKRKKQAPPEEVPTIHEEETSRPQNSIPEPVEVKKKAAPKRVRRAPTTNQKTKEDRPVPSVEELLKRPGFPMLSRTQTVSDASLQPKNLVQSRPDTRPESQGSPCRKRAAEEFNLETANPRESSDRVLFEAGKVVGGKRPEAASQSTRTTLLVPYTGYSSAPNKSGPPSPTKINDTSLLNNPPENLTPTNLDEIDAFVARLACRPAPTPFPSRQPLSSLPQPHDQVQAQVQEEEEKEKEDLRRYAALPDGERATELDQWMEDAIMDDDFMTLCEDIDVTWRRMAFGIDGRAHGLRVAAEESSR